MTTREHPPGGTSRGGFETRRTVAVPGLAAVLGEHVHAGTGARHLHLECDAGHEAFMVAFSTAATDSSGVAHVLEHLVLGGSARYPCRRAFFSMLGRTLSTAMNASTSADCTTFHFATHDRRDFDNLLSVYLDAVFFPLLHPLDFDQEACRVEFERPLDPTSALVRRGVVLNEMKGMAGDPDHRLERAIDRALLAATPYRFDAGGDPGAIAGLRHEDLVAWHRRHYHPGNALFLSAGRRPAAALQERLETLALAALTPDRPGLPSPAAPRRTGPVRVGERVAASGPGGAAGGSVAVAWLLGDGGDAADLALARLLDRCLLAQEGAPLRALLESSPIGGTPAAASGLRESRRRLTLQCALHGCDPARAAELEGRVLETLAAAARDGLPAGVAEGAVDRMERDILEQHDPRRPYLLALLERMLPAALHGGDPVALLDPREPLSALRRRIARDGALRALLRETLIDNEERACVALVPDAALAARRSEAEAAALARERDAMDAAARARLVERSRRLRARQLEPPDESCLPTIALAELGPAREAAPLRARTARVWASAGRTTGLVYARLAVAVPPPPTGPAAPGSELGALCEALPHVGRGALPAARARVDTARVCDGVGVEPLVLGERAFVLLEARALERDARALCTLLDELHRGARFDRAAAQPLDRALARHGAALTAHGHVYAQRAAAAGLGGMHAAVERWLGMTSLRALRAALAGPEATRALEIRLERLHALLAGARPWVQIVCEQDSQAPDAAGAIWAPGGDSPAGAAPRPAGTEASTARGDAPAPGLRAWRIESPVSYCARVYRAAPAEHPDAAALAVLAAHLGGDPLQGAIRERGGAYGAGARYCDRTATVRLFSYRDPRLADTLRDFDDAVARVVASPPSGHALASAVLGVVRELDRPSAFQRAALARFVDLLAGRPAHHASRMREAVLAITAERLGEVARRYLDPGLAHDGALASPERADELAAAGTPVNRIDG